MNETMATGLRLPEGPVALTDGRIALVETDDSRRCLTMIVGGIRREICRTGGRPTGLAVDGDNCFWVAGGPENSLVRLSPEGRTLQVIEGGNDGAFLYPNDLAFGPDGLLYMTDSGVRISDLLDGADINPDFFQAPYNGRVYQIDPAEGRVQRVLATGLLYANGIAFGPDGLLYYSETLTGKIYRQIVGGRQELFAQVMPAPAVKALCGPAGMAFDRNGTLYCTIYGQGEICMVDPAGKIAGRIRTNGTRPGNIAFTLDGKYALITEQENGVLERIVAPRPGLALHMPAFGS
ncbi:MULTISPECIES: SMP-30/gluconolactonase/LRE family protein [unclassified Rhizobium]|uniref:SMP-30/gluconolactonase/LRE family protein n=1 Tax=unclassified Rhizobium TaxID=2613769 RepID=UPI000CDF35D4|nr:MULTISPECIES: SMP-30/gluconolactonase/LRE family protein [Rhizobium]AVA20292.1 SMP-30/gluconolaconase/LRE domain-containing protein [Rhizobium sp. NXC24]UWU21584.1 SMP-30/gluconolactonase/LRE family protein [Rhizobium tropici]